jgi:HNH endonuclease
VSEGSLLQEGELAAAIRELVVGLQPVIANARQLRLRILDPWRDSKRSVQEQADFKAALLEFYGCDAEAEGPQKPMAMCMVSRKVFPQPVVIASHVWKHSTGGDGLHEFGLNPADLNSPRNGLLMASEIEAAFDAKRVSFSFDLLTDSFTFHVLDSTLLDDRILNVKDKKTSNSLLGYACLDPDSIPSFRMLDNMKMSWTPSACPFRRLLAWHYAMATMHAKRLWWHSAESPHPASVVGNAGLSAFSPSVLWPSRDVLDLFDHAVSKSERVAEEQAERHVAGDDADSST